MGHKMTELDLLPEDWEVVRLGVIAEKFIGGGTPSTSKEEYWNGEIHWTTSKKINGIHLLNGEKKITKRGLEESSTHLIPKDNLVIGTRVGVGKVAINKVDIAISQDLTGAFIDKEKYALEFLAYQICTKEIQNIFKGRARGTTIKGIPRDDLKKISLKIPPLPEQHRIAAVLSAAQDAKEKTGAVVTAAKSLKKSLMRHLFTYGPVPAGAEDRVPLVDTEIGLVPEGWGVVRLGEYTKVRYGLGQPPKLADDGVPMIRATNIKRGKITPDGLIRIKHDAIPLSRDPFLKEGDIIVVRSGAYTGDLAMITKSWDGSIAGYDLIVSPLATFDPSYLSEYLLYDVPQSYFASQKARSAQPHLNARELSNTIVPLPSYLVQQKIASILSTVDKKIETEENKKKALDELFKSLLRNLMTAKIRVNHLEVVQ